MGNAAIYQFGWIMALFFGLSSIILMVLWLRARNTIRRLAPDHRKSKPPGASRSRQKNGGPQPQQGLFAERYSTAAEGAQGRKPQLGETPATDQTHMFIPKSRDNSVHRDSQWGLPYLKVIKGRNPGGVYHLPYAETSIGRDDTNLIVLDDSCVSAVNTKIVYQGHAFVIHDNRSTNGTLHQGEPVSRAELTFGDRIGIGNSELIFSCKGFELKETAPAEAISAFEAMLVRAPDCIAAMKNLAYLLERDVARRKQAQPIWDRVLKLEKSAHKTHEP